jgi:hypothetical protein
MLRFALLIVLLLAFSFNNAVGQCNGTVTSISIPRNIGCSFGTGNNATWDGPSGGTISDPGGGSSIFTVTWTTTGTFRLKRTFPVGCTGTPLYSNYFTIVASPATPSTTEVNQQSGCGQVTLNYTGGVYDTYWQTSTTGTDETNRATRVVTSPGTYYARIKNSLGCWGNARSITVSSIPSTPIGGTLSGGGAYFFGSVNRTLRLGSYTGTIIQYRYKENGGADVVVSNTLSNLTVSFSNPTGSTLSRQYWAVVSL